MEREMQSIKSKLDITRDDSFTPSEIVRLESLIDSNKRDIMKLYDKVVSEENDREVDDLAGRDLVDDTIEMRTLFTENQFDKIIIDIPKTRLAIKFMLKFMDLSKIDDNEISLLRKISNASKTAARARADPEQCCWGGARTVGGVRARRRFAPSSKCDRGSAKRLPRELRQGSGGAKIGLLESRMYLRALSKQAWSDQ